MEILVYKGQQKMEIVGIILLIVGGIGFFYGFFMDISVSGVYNIGLLSDRQNTFVFSGVLAILGAIFIAINEIKIEPNKKKLLSSENIKKLFKNLVILCIVWYFLFYLPEAWHIGYYLREAWRIAYNRIGNWVVPLIGILLFVYFLNIYIFEFWRSSIFYRLNFWIFWFIGWALFFGKPPAQMEKNPVPIINLKLELPAPIIKAEPIKPELPEIPREMNQIELRIENKKEKNESKKEKKDLEIMKLEFEKKKKDLEMKKDKLKELNKSYRDAGDKSREADKADQFEEAKKWKDKSLKEYSEWKKLKAELDAKSSVP